MKKIFFLFCTLMMAGSVFAAEADKPPPTPTLYNSGRFCAFRLTAHIENNDTQMSFLIDLFIII